MLKMIEMREAGMKGGCGEGARDYDDGVCGNSHSDSLVIDRTDAHGGGFQSKAFASQHSG